MITSSPRWLVFALAQGIVAPLLLAAVAIFGGARQPGYSHISQAISELTQVGAVSKPFLDASIFLMEILTIVFGVGFYVVVRKSNFRLRVCAALLVFIGVIGLGFARFPMDPTGTEITFDGWVHLIIVTLSAIAAVMAVILSAQGWRGVKNGKTLAWFSWLAVAIMLTGGIGAALVGWFGWPAIGIWQRINTAAFGVWQIASAVHLLRRVA